jgi:toxin ParE1/3/4
MVGRGLQLRLTPLAESDLEDVWRYTFAHWSIDQADRYHRDLVATMDALARGDKIGRVCPVRDGYRQYAVGSHIVFYRETETTLDVIRVLHQRMDVDRHL